MHALVENALRRVVAHLRELPGQPMHDTAGGRKRSRALVGRLPEHGRPGDDVLRQLFDHVIPASLNTASPGYLGYIPGGGIFPAAVADFVADATNRYVGIWQAGPGPVAVELAVLRWFRELVGFPSSGGGVLTTGGSMANLLAVVSARRDRLPADFLRGVLYASDQVHHSVVKAALVAGFPEERVRALPSDGAFRLRLDALDEHVARDRAAGLQPFMLVASAGTTHTGAVDDLGACADAAREHGLWFHVDAAYGGFFLLTEHGRSLLAGIHRADSVTLDPHKGLFLPYGTGCVLVRDVETLRRAHRVQADYLPPPRGDDGLWDFADLSPELSRDWRGLRVWLPLQLHGAAAFRAALNEKLALARLLHAELAARRWIDVVAPPQLSLLAFRARAPDLPPDEADALTRRLLSGVNQQQRVFLSGTSVRGRPVLRACVLSFRTHEDRIRLLLEDLDRVGRELGLAGP
ncbi:MAG: decarboxylase [Deltaproteobacteria bacterium]|nr:decarboxylase [Deltaproteobacteria bacterium]